MTAYEAYSEAHERVLRCESMIRLLTMALDNGINAIGADERDSLSTGMHRALEDAGVARECFASIPVPAK